MIPLAFALLFALAGGLSLRIGRTAPVSAFFCVQITGTPNFGVAVGNKTQAKAWNTDAGLIPRENPDSGFWNHHSKG